MAAWSEPARDPSEGQSGTRVRKARGAAEQPSSRSHVPDGDRRRKRLAAGAGPGAKLKVNCSRVPARAPSWHTDLRVGRVPECPIYGVENWGRLICFRVLTASG